MSKDPSKKDLLTDLKRVADKINRSPTVAQYRNNGEYSIKVIKRRFGSWNNAKKQAGLEVYSYSGNQKYSDEELLDDLRKFANNCDGSPTSQRYCEREGPNSSTIIDRFGSWDEAMKQAGVENLQCSLTYYDSKQDLLDDLKNVAEAIRESPSIKQYRTHGEYSPTSFQNEFGSWNRAKEQAGLDIYSPDKLVPAEKLVCDLQQTADRLGGPPTKKQYDELGAYSHTICQQRFGSWNNALRAASIGVNLEINISKEAVVNDIQNVASIVDRTPTADDYREHGEHSLKPALRHFESWIDALTAAGFDWVPYQYSDEELLKSLRDVADSEYAPRRVEYQKRWSHKNIQRRFGSWWAGCVQAGLLPRRRHPLSPRAIHEYHQTAISLEPHYGTYALLFQFTGIPPRIVQNFSPDWVADRQNRNIIRVPFEETKSGEPWLFQYPDTWHNPYTGRQEATELPETLEWFTNNYDAVPRTETTFYKIIKRVASQGDLEEHRHTVHRAKVGEVPDVRPADLWMTQGVNLACQDVKKKTISRRLGIEESDWGGDVRDCYLWAFVHRDTEPQNYDPPDVILDPI